MRDYHVAMHRVLAALRGDSPTPGRPVPPEILSLLDECDDVRTLLRDASEMSRCDFTVVHDPVELPALAPRYAVGLRDLFLLIMADGRQSQSAGDREALADRSIPDIGSIGRRRIEARRDLRRGLEALRPRPRGADRTDES